MVKPLSAQSLSNLSHICLIHITGNAHVFGQLVHIEAHRLQPVDGSECEIFRAREVDGVAKVADVICALLKQRSHRGRAHHRVASSHKWSLRLVRLKHATPSRRYNRPCVVGLVECRLIFAWTTLDFSYFVQRRSNICLIWRQNTINSLGAWVFVGHEALLGIFGWILRDGPFIHGGKRHSFELGLVFVSPIVVGVQRASNDPPETHYAVRIFATFLYSSLVVNVGLSISCRQRKSACLWWSTIDLAFLCYSRLEPGCVLSRVESRSVGINACNWNCYSCTWHLRVTFLCSSSE